MDLVYSHPTSGFTIPLHMFQNKNYLKLCNRYLLENDHPIIKQLFVRNALAGIIARGTQGQFARVTHVDE